MRNVVLLGDSNLAMARSQLGPFLRAAAEHPAFRVIAVVDTSKTAVATLSGRLQSSAKARLVRALNPHSKAFLRRYASLEVTAAQYGLKVQRPPARSVNSTEFLRRIAAIDEPRVAISLGCLQIFKQDLLDHFEQTINFHNGLLPDYRGLGATSWSLYNGEQRSGFSFHRMTAGVDEGPVLVDGSVAVDETTYPGALETAKLDAAAKLVPRVLEAVDRNEPGRDQSADAGRTYTARDLKAIRRIESPGALPGEEIRRRSRCFTELNIRLGEAWWPVTEVSPRGRPAIPTADGDPLGIYRARYLPTWVYSIARAAGLG